MRNPNALALMVLALLYYCAINHKRSLSTSVWIAHSSVLPDSSDVMICIDAQKAQAYRLTTRHICRGLHAC